MKLHSSKEATASQHARFVEAAREAGADIDTSAADALMGRLAKTPPGTKAGPKSPKQPKTSTDL